MTLVFCSDGKYDGDGACANSSSVTKPTINTTYFPTPITFLETYDYNYWTSTPYRVGNDTAWYVKFGSGRNSSTYKTSNYSVRLVRR